MDGLEEGRSALGLAAAVVNWNAHAKPRAPGAYDVDKASDDTGFKCLDASLTQQSMKDEADINVLVKRFNIGYSMPQGLRAPVFQDFVGIFDFQDAMNAVNTARDAFMALEPDVRARFGNDPQQFVEFASDAANADELVRLGLADPRVAPPEPVPIKVEVINPRVEE